MPDRRVLYNLQALRALAAMMVVFYHARALSPFGPGVSFDFGNAGVDIFFFISGFIIPFTTSASGPAAIGPFLVKRAIRLLPLYWPLTIIVFLIMLKVPSLAGSGGLPNFTMLLQSLGFVPHFNAMGENYPVVFVGWTLNMEVFFYALFAMSLLIPGEVSRIVALSLTLAGLELLGWLTHPAGAIAQAYTDPLIIEFAMGLWLNLVFKRMEPRTTGRLGSVAWIGAMLVAGGLLVAGDYLWPNAHRLFKWGMPSLVIVGGALVLERRNVALRGTALLLLGEASYAIYLVHPFVIKAATILLSHLPALSSPIRALALLLTCSTVVIVSIALHQWGESPVMAVLRRLLLPARGKPA